MEGEVQLGIITLIVVLVALWIFFNYHPLPTISQNNEKKASVAEALNKMKRLWTERSYLTRMSNIESLTGYTGASVTNEQVLANSQQIGRNLANLYGQGTGDILSNLFLEYHQIMFDLLRDARERRDTGPLYRQLQSKSHEMIDFLLQICPCTKRQKLEDLMSIHLDTFMKNIVHTIRDENVASMAAFNAYTKSSNDLVDYIGDCVWAHLIGPGPRYT
jgi:hypothetical protein